MRLTSTAHRTKKRVPPQLANADYNAIVNGPENWLPLSRNGSLIAPLLRSPTLHHSKKGPSILPARSLDRVSLVSLTPASSGSRLL